MEKGNSDERAMSGVHQLIPPDEIKQEPDIKAEPGSDGDLDEFPALINDDVAQLSGNPGRDDGHGNIVNVPLDEVKSEVKEERGEEIGKVSKPNGTNKRAMNKRQCEHSRSSRANRKNNSKRNVRKPIHEKVAKPHKCGQCDYTTGRKYLLDNHLRMHTGEKPFPCSHCPKAFTQMHHLRNHMKMHVDDFPFICAVCLKGFDDKDQKMKHEKDCRIRRYECHLCKQSFGSMKGHLMEHIRIHSGAKPFKCKDCLKKFSTDRNFKTHIKIHSGRRSIHCSKCRGGFFQQDEMVAHERNCSRRVYECYVCRKFIGLKKGNLENHMRTHTGEKPFQCMVCSKKHAVKFGLTYHMKFIHNKSR